MQSLGQACIFCASNPKGQTTFFASYVVAGKVLPPGSKFFISFSNSSNPLSDKPFDAFHCNNSNVVPNFFWSCLQSGYKQCSVVLQHTLQISRFLFCFANFLRLAQHLTQIIFYNVSFSIFFRFTHCSVFKEGIMVTRWRTKGTSWSQ